MYFLVDHDKKVVFGWTPKCGCTHIKKIFYYLINEPNRKIHTALDFTRLNSFEYSDYQFIIIIRNPYHRIVSGFLDKYSLHGEFRKKWNPNKMLTFRNFVDELESTRFKYIDSHHFLPQTAEEWNKNILNCKYKFFDLGNIDYQYIENLYSTKIPEELIHFKGTHANILNLDYHGFYNSELKNKVYTFYKKDFELFKSIGVEYS